MKGLIDLRDTGYRSALHYAAWNNHVAAAKLLLQHGADPNSRDFNGVIPLHEAAQHGSDEVVQLLIDNGAHLELVDFYHRTPLFYACIYGRSSCVQLLLRAQQPTTMLSHTGANLLGSSFLRSPSVRISHMLTHRGMDSFHFDVHDVCAMHYMLASPEPKHLRLLLQSYPCLDQMHAVDWTPSISSRCGYLWTDNLIQIAHGYRLVSRFCTQAPLCVSETVTKGQDSLFYLVSSRGIVSAIDGFLAIGIDLEHECTEQGTAIIVASTNGRLDAVRYLVRRGAKLDYEKNGQRRNAITAALGHREVLDWLLVRRHTEQRKIAYCKPDSCSQDTAAGNTELRPQPGRWVIKMTLKWGWGKRRSETMLEYACRRCEIITKMRGEEVNSGELDFVGNLESSILL